MPYLNVGTVVNAYKGSLLELQKATWAIRAVPCVSQGVQGGCPGAVSGCCTLVQSFYAHHMGCAEWGGVGERVDRPRTKLYLVKLLWNLLHASGFI